MKLISFIVCARIYINRYEQSQILNHLPISMSKIKRLESDQDLTNKHLKQQKDELNNQNFKDEGKAGSKLVYQGGNNDRKNQKSQAKGEINGEQKKETKTEIKTLKNENRAGTLKRAAFFGEQKKKKVQKLAYPPPTKELALSNPKTTGKEDEKAKKIEQLSSQEAKLTIAKMRLIYKKDHELFCEGKLACYKVKFLEKLTQKMSNAYLRRHFLLRRGLRQFQRWLSPILNAEQIQFEPSLTLKLGLLRIIQDMGLSAEYINKSNRLTILITKCLKSQFGELRDLSADILREWDYVIMNENAQEQQQKK